MRDWCVVDIQGEPCLFGRTEGHPSPFVTPGNPVVTSPIVGRDGALVVTRSGTRYALDADWGDLSGLLGEIDAGEVTGRVSLQEAIRRLVA